MFCKNCGNQIADGSLFCTVCGAAVAGNDAADAAPAAPTAAPQNDDFVLSSTAQSAPKKKSLKWIAPVAAVAVVAAAAIVVALNWGNWFGGNSGGNGGDGGKDDNDDDISISETVSDDDDNRQEQGEADAVDSLVDTITGIYGTLLEEPTDLSVGADVDVSVYVGDYVIDMLEQQFAQQSGQNMDMDWMSEIVLGMDMDIADDITQMQLMLALADHQLVSLDAIVDFSQEMLYMGCPELTNTYAGLDFATMGLDMSTFQMAQQQIDDMRAYLPSEQTLNKLLTKYVELAVDNLDVKEAPYTLELDGLKQDCTAMTISIGAEDVYNVLTAVLTEAKTDADLKTVIDNLSAYYSKQMGAAETYDMYPDFVAAIEELLTSLEGQKDGLADAAGGIVLQIYVDGADSLIGMKLTVEDDYDSMEVYYYTVTEGNTFNFEASAAQVQIVGSGTIKGDMVDAEYTMTLNGTDLLVLEVMDYDTASASKGYINGTFRLEPTADLISLMMGSSSAASFADVALELTIATSEKSVNLRLDVLTNDVLIVGIGIGTSTGKADDIQIPSQYIDPTDQEELMKWVEGFNFDEILDNMRDAGVPEELVALAEQALQGMMGSAEEDTVAPAPYI